MGIFGAVGGGLAKRMTPGMAGQAVRAILERAIDGVPGLPGAARSADAALRRTGGDTEAAVDSLISRHVRMAGAQGFLTNVGGLVTAAVTLPANLAAVALVQCHLAASIAAVRGYDLSRPAVRDAVLICLLDADGRDSVAPTKRDRRAATPAAVAVSDDNPDRSDRIARAVTGQLLAGMGGKQVASFFARRIPVLGGAVGGFGDAMATRRIGRDTAAGLPPQPHRPAVISSDPVL